MNTAVLTVPLPATDVFGSAVAWGNSVRELIRTPPVAKRDIYESL